jgi:hypothetical protein
MDYKLCRQITRGGNNRLTGFATTLPRHNLTAIAQYGRSARPVNSTIYTSPTHQRRVGGIYNGIYGYFGDVGKDYPDFIGRIIHRLDVFVFRGFDLTFKIMAITNADEPYINFS